MGYKRDPVPPAKRMPFILSIVYYEYTKVKTTKTLHTENKKTRLKAGVHFLVEYQLLILFHMSFKGVSTSTHPQLSIPPKKAHIITINFRLG